MVERDDVLAAASSAAAARVADLEEELAAVEEATAAGPDDEHDAEGSTVGYERARVAGLLGAARGAVAALTAARERRSAGIAETCDGCGQAIDPRRLDALPATRLCVDCAELGNGRHVPGLP